MNELVEFAKSRISMTEMGEKDDLYIESRTWSWFKKNNVNVSVIDGFIELCRLAIFESDFFCHYWLPKIIFHINPSGTHITDFLKSISFEKSEEENLSLLCSVARFVSVYYENNNNWFDIVDCICSKVEELRLKKRDRQEVYYCLSLRETPAMTTMPGDVNGYFYEQVDIAARMYDLGRSRERIVRYLEWNLKLAKDRLDNEKGFMEELDHDTY